MSENQGIGGQAVQMWEALTGKPVDSRSYTFTVGGQSFNLYDANERVKQAKAVGDELTVALVVKVLSEQYAEAETFSLAEYLNGSERLRARLDLVGRMAELFASDALSTRSEEFFRYCAGALAYYRDLTPETLTEQTMALVRQSGSFIGLDAFHGIDRLTRLMVRDGPVGDASIAKVSRLVFTFDSIDELITHAKRIPVGYSLCLIAAEHVSDSYFVMVVNTGGRILALTDKGNYSHPLQEARMRSRNDRYNQRRIGDSHFPYGLLDIQWADNGRMAIPGEARTELAAPNTDLRVLGSLADLDDWDLLWLHLFIDQCRARYFEQRIAEPLLATGSMVRLPHIWAPAQEQLPVPAEFELRLETRSSVDLNTTFLHSIEPEWAGRYNPNLWMEERFAASVPDECLYLPANALNGETPLLERHNAGHRLTRRDLGGLHEWDLRLLPTVRLEGLSATALSTPDRVIRDCHFLARHNQAEVIRRLVSEDYKARKNALQRWFYEAAARHVPDLIEDLLALDHERIAVNSPRHQAALQSLGQGKLIKGKGGFVAFVTDYREIGFRYRLPRMHHIPWRDRDQPSLALALDLTDFDAACYRCAVNPEEQAQLFIVLDVSSVFDLMTVTGLQLDDIPPELRHRGVDVYTGNSILSRIDPLSRLSNPWDELDLEYVLPVSLKAFKALRRRKGLPIPRATEIEAFAKQQAKEFHKRAAVSRGSVEG